MEYKNLISAVNDVLRIRGVKFRIILHVDINTFASRYISTSNPAALEITKGLPCYTADTIVCAHNNVYDIHVYTGIADKPGYDPVPAYKKV